MSYWDAVLAVTSVVGIIALILVGVCGVFIAIYLTFAMKDPGTGKDIKIPWWFRTLGALYLLSCIVFGIAAIVWDVTNS